MSIKGSKAIELFPKELLLTEQIQQLPVANSFFFFVNLPAIPCLLGAAQDNLFTETNGECAFVQLGNFIVVDCESCLAAWAVQNPFECVSNYQSAEIRDHNPHTFSLT